MGIPWGALRTTWRILVGLRSFAWASPKACSALFTVAFLVVAVAGLFNVRVARLITIPGALALDLGILWILLRFVVRLIVFPGSVVLWRRNTEAAYRAAMAKQFLEHLEQLHHFALVAMRRPPTPIGATLEGAMLGLAVVASLVVNFKVQESDNVRFTSEQDYLRQLCDTVNDWLSAAKIRERKSSSRLAPLTEWLDSVGRNPSMSRCICSGASMELLESDPKTSKEGIDCLEQLVELFAELTYPKSNCCVRAVRFLQSPTVGSLHQLRAEMRLRYTAQQFWVTRAWGRKLDAMLISPAPVSEGEDEKLFAGPIVVWCNPNAGYYETMVYEAQWLDFYVSQGCSLFLWNYRGYGRSAGRPSPSSLASDVDSILDFLRGRGATQIGVHGRSIGGIAACHLVSARHASAVRFLVTDRTFSSLGCVARCTFGGWAEKCLALAAVSADNFKGFSAATCYKVMICDPRDQVVPDLAALRTAVATAALERLPPAERLVVQDEDLVRFAEAWAFLKELVRLANTDARELETVIGNAEGGSQREGSEEASSSSGAEEAKLIVAEPMETAGEAVDLAWLSRHRRLARRVLGAHGETLQTALAKVGASLNGGGGTLDDTIDCINGAPSEALRAFLANLQTWGSVGSPVNLPCPVLDSDIELFLTRNFEPQERPELARRVERLATVLTPERLSAYHGQLACSVAAQARAEVQRRFGPLREAFGASSRESPLAQQLAAVVLRHVNEVESFLVSIDRFLGRAGAEPLSPPGRASPDVEAARLPSGAACLGAQNRSLTGYMVPVTCGHNGFLGDGELRHLGLHLRAAGFCSLPEAPTRIAAVARSPTTKRASSEVQRVA